MKVQEFLDFEIEINLGKGREYPVAVRSLSGEAHEQLIFPFDELALESRLKDLQIALLRSGGSHRLALTQQEKSIQDFGQILFDALMTGEIRSRFDVARREAARQGKGLRIKLRIQPPELLILPWEFLYDQRGSGYICLSTQTPLVRYIELSQVVLPLTITPPLRILGITSSPLGLTGLDIENEKLRVETALKDRIERKQISITWQDHTTWRSLQSTLRNSHWHILHFIGHGGFDYVRDEGFIALEDENGELARLAATHLARLLANHITLRLVILNSCEGAQGGNKDIFSSTASVLVRRGLPAVLAMQYTITDRAAIEFARGFYEALADGLPVDTATAEARVSVSLGVTNTIEWGTPVLFMRASDGVLFRLGKAPRRIIKPEPHQGTQPIDIGEKQKRVLEAAIEKEITIGKATQLFVLIRRLESKGIIFIVKSVDDDVLLDENQIKSKEFQLEFPVQNSEISPVGITLRLTAQDFQPAEQEKYILISPNEDSEVITFMITPKTRGSLKLQLEVFKEKINLASRTLKTTCIGTSVTNKSFELFTIPMVVFVQNPAHQAEHLTILKAEEKRLTQEKAKAEQKAREEMERVARAQAEREAAEREAIRLKSVRKEAKRMIAEKRDKRIHIIKAGFETFRIRASHVLRRTQITNTSKQDVLYWYISLLGVIGVLESFAIIQRLGSAGNIGSWLAYSFFPYIEKSPILAFYCLIAFSQSWLITKYKYVLGIIWFIMTVVIPVGLIGLIQKITQEQAKVGIYNFATSTKYFYLGYYIWFLLALWVVVVPLFMAIWNQRRRTSPTSSSQTQ